MVALRLRFALPALLAALLAAGPVRADKPRKESPVRHDAQGDPLPPGALARLGTVRLRHTTRIVKVAFTADSKLLFGLAQGEGILWDAATGKEVRRSALSGYFAGLLSSGGKTIVWLAKPNELVGKDLHSERSISLSLPGVSRFRRVCLSPDGRMAALLEEGAPQARILLCDLTIQEVRHSVPWENSLFTELAFSPDGKTLAVTSSSPQLRLLDAATGARKRAWEVSPVGAYSLAFSADGKTLATSGRLDGPPRWCLRLWDPTTGKLLHETLRPQLPEGLTFLPDGKTLLAREKSLLQLYDGKTGRHLRSLAHIGPVETIALAPDGKTLATVKSGEQAVDLWDTAGWKPRHHFPGHRCCVTDLAFSPDGKLLASSACSSAWTVPECYRGMRLWDVASGAERGCFGVEWGMVTSLSFSPDGRLLAVGTDEGAIHLWSPRTLAEVRALHCGRTPWSLRWSADGKSLLFQNARNVFLRDASGETERKLLSTEMGIAALSHDGSLAAVDRGSFNARSNDFVGALMATEKARHLLSYGNAQARAFSPDGKLLAVTSPEGIVVWDLVEKKKAAEIPVPAEKQPRLLLFTPAQRCLIGYSGDTITLWELATEEQRACFQVPPDAVTTLAMSPDGRTLASAHRDTTILLWDLVGRRLAQPREINAASVASLWRELSASDAVAGYRAVRKAALNPREALPLLRRHLGPVVTRDPVTRQQVQKLIAELDSADFGTRNRATDELIRRVEQAEPLLRQALADGPTAEAHWRIQSVLRRLRVSWMQRLRQSRALEAVENMDTPQARQYLETLASGAPGAWLTEQATEALSRLGPQLRKP